jgi:hypothetical protein
MNQSVNICLRARESVELIVKKKKSRPRLRHGRLSGELLGLACGVCSFKQENYWTRISTISDYQSRGQAAATSL